MKSCDISNIKSIKDAFSKIDNPNVDVTISGGKKEISVEFFPISRNFIELANQIVNSAKTAFAKKFGIDPIVDNNGYSTVLQIPLTSHNLNKIKTVNSVKNPYIDLYSQQSPVTNDEFYDRVLTQLLTDNIAQRECSGVKAEDGMRFGFTPGGKWDIIKEFRGASHERGGIDISIGEDGINITGKNGIYKAENGLVIGSDSLFEDIYSNNLNENPEWDSAFQQQELIQNELSNPQQQYVSDASSAQQNVLLNSETPYIEVSPTQPINSQPIEQQVQPEQVLLSSQSQTMMPVTPQSQNPPITPPNYNTNVPKPNGAGQPTGSGGQIIKVQLPDGTITSYDTGTKEYQDLYDTGKLANYDEQQDLYILPPLEETVITGESPDYMKYQNEFKANNPKEKYIQDNYLTPFARSLGNSETNYPAHIDEKYENAASDYAGQQIVKNKPQGNMSRAQWLDSLTAPEEELVKRDPKYQSTIWDDTKRGIISLMESNPAQAMQNILNSTDFSKREKVELLKDYVSHPVATKFSEALQSIGFVSIGGKLVQASLKDDYTVNDALSGKKNDASLAEDIATDPLNLVGLGIWGVLSKTRGFSKLSDLYNSVKGLPKEKALAQLAEEAGIKIPVERDPNKVVYITREGRNYVEPSDDYLVKINKDLQDAKNKGVEFAERWTYQYEKIPEYKAAKDSYEASKENLALLIDHYTSNHTKFTTDEVVENKGKIEKAYKEYKDLEAKLYDLERNILDPTYEKKVDAVIGAEKAEESKNNPVPSNVPHQTFPSDRTTVVHVDENDPGFQSLSQTQKDKVKSKDGSVEGFNNDQGSVIIGSNKYDGDAFGMEGSTVAIPKNPEEVYQTTIHEGAHDGQRIKGWEDAVDERSSTYNYNTANKNTEIGREFSEAMVEPRADPSGKATAETWLSSVKELHSETMTERSIVVEEIMNAKNISQAEAIKILKEDSDEYIRRLAESPRIKQFFKKEISTETIMGLLKKLPMFVGGVVGADQVTNKETQQ